MKVVAKRRLLCETCCRRLHATEQLIGIASVGRGVRFEHLEDAAKRTRASGVGGVVLSLACGTLARERASVTPFGLEWIRSGRLASFVGASGAVEIEPLARITTDLLDARTAGRHLRLSDLVRDVDARVHASDDERLARAWSSFRLLGNPLAAV